MASVDTEMENGNILTGKWRKESPPEISCLRRMGGKRFAKIAKEIRDQFFRFFNGLAKYLDNGSIWYKCFLCVNCVEGKVESSSVF